MKSYNKKEVEVGNKVKSVVTQDRQGFELDNRAEYLVDHTSGENVNVVRVDGLEFKGRRKWKLKVGDLQKL